MSSGFPERAQSFESGAGTAGSPATRSPPPRTATCSTSTTTSRRSSTCGCGSSPARSRRPGRRAPGRRRGRVGLARRRGDRVRGARHRRRARDRHVRRRSRQRASSSARATCCSAGSRGSTTCLSGAASGGRSFPSRLAMLDGDFAERVRPWPQIGQALLSAPRRRSATSTCCARSPANPRLEVRLTLSALAPRGALGTGRARRNPGAAPADPPPARPPRRRRAPVGLARARPPLPRGSASRGHADEWHLHGTLEEHLAALVGARRTSAKPAARRRPR